jgi:aminoglycoside phosphotransferase (APT) family kinase protein
MEGVRVGAATNRSELRKSSPLLIGETDLRVAALRWARHRYGSDVEVHGLSPMPGNSGLSFGFDVLNGDGNAEESVVLRLAPPGVRRSGNTDVLRQVQLLKALEEAGIPVAPLLWWSPDESWFGTDAIAQRRVRALPLHMHDREMGVDPGLDGVDSFVQRAVSTLAEVHGLDWATLLDGWEQPASSAEEIARWEPVLAKAPERSWGDAGSRLRDALLVRPPERGPVGLYHGDYQTNNVLFSPTSGDVVAVVDWEIAGIGMQGLDVGWLSIMTDLSFWGPEQRARMQVRTDPKNVRRWYEEASRVALDSFDWYRALAAYRFGAIAAYNVRLHRTGRRIDVNYEILESSVETLFARGLDLVQASRPVAS